MRVVDVRASEADAALRVRGSPGPGVVSEPIGPAFATPVCHSALARRLRKPADLVTETLIEMRGAAEGSWMSAFHRNGLGPSALNLLSFESYLETLIAAERGLGVAFGLFPMTTEWVERGRLAVPFPVRTPLEGGVYLVFRPQDRRRDLLVRIASSLRVEYAKLTPVPDGRILSWPAARGAPSPSGARGAHRLASRRRAPA